MDNRNTHSHSSMISRPTPFIVRTPLTPSNLNLTIGNKRNLEVLGPHSTTPVLRDVLCTQSSRMFEIGRQLRSALSKIILYALITVVVIMIEFNSLPRHFTRDLYLNQAAKCDMVSRPPTLLCPEIVMFYHLSLSIYSTIKFILLARIIASHPHLIIATCNVHTFCAGVELTRSKSIFFSKHYLCKKATTSPVAIKIYNKSTVKGLQNNRRSQEKPLYELKIMQMIGMCM